MMTRLVINFSGFLNYFVVIIQFITSLLTLPLKNVLTAIFICEKTKISPNILMMKPLAIYPPKGFGRNNKNSSSNDPKKNGTIQK